MIENVIDCNIRTCSYIRLRQISNATCNLDPIPTWLLKLCASELTPVIMKMINLSLSEGHVPEAWKVAILIPILKKYGLDLVFENFMQARQ